MTPNTNHGPTLIVLHGSEDETTYLLETPTTRIGRAADSDIEIDHPKASRHHAVITRKGEGTFVRDLESLNGTMLNDVRLSCSAVELKHGDKIQIAQTTLRYVAQTLSGGSGDNDTTELDTLLDQSHVGGAHRAAQKASRCTVSAALRSIPAAASNPRLILSENGSAREFFLREDRLTMGRGATANIRIPCASVSLLHAEVVKHGDEFVVHAISDGGEVRVNGIVVRDHKLVHGDLIRIGNKTVRFFKREQSVADLFLRTRRPLVLIPGFCGSELWKGSQRMWPNHQRLLTSTEQRIRDDWSDVQVGQLVNKTSKLPGLPGTQSFGALVEFLTSELGYESGRDLLEFPYDWRQDNYQSARQLAEAIGQWRATRPNPTEPVTIVAHSMGGIVARLYLNAFGGTDSVERCVFLGTPHQGSLMSLQLVLGGVGILPFGLPIQRVRNVVLGFPSIYQLFPSWPGAELEDGSPFFPLETEPDWLPPVARPHFEAAVKVRRLLHASKSDVDIPTTCIFGYQKKTPDRLVLKRDRSGHMSVSSIGHSAVGDGTVPQVSAVLRHAEVHPVVQKHCALHTDQDVMKQLRYELVERLRDVPLAG